MWPRFITGETCANRDDGGTCDRLLTRNSHERIHSDDVRSAVPYDQQHHEAVLVLYLAKVKLKVCAINVFGIFDGSVFAKADPEMVSLEEIDVVYQRTALY